jgi:hypothetical protein
MIIYPLPPAELDDKTLDKNIRAIAKTLCNVHYELLFNKRDGDLKLLREEDRQKWINIPLGWSTSKTVEYTKWASECRANYLKLVEMALALRDEHCYRHIRYAGIYGDEKYFEAIIWASTNTPDLPRYFGLSTDPTEDPGVPRSFDGKTTPFPLAIPNNYYSEPLKMASDLLNEEGLQWQTIVSYRNYYRAKIKAQIHKLDNSIGCGCPECDKNFWDKYPKWTRRDKPSYLNEVGDGN